MCDDVCANCELFAVLDDGPRDPRDWFGVCMEARDEQLGVEGNVESVTTWFACNGRHGGDGCADPEGWFCGIPDD